MLSRFHFADYVLTYRDIHRKCALLIKFNLPVWFYKKKVIVGLFYTVSVLYSSNTSTYLDIWLHVYICIKIPEASMLVVSSTKQTEFTSLSWAAMLRLWGKTSAPIEACKCNFPSDRQADRPINRLTDGQTGS